MEDRLVSFARVAAKVAKPCDGGTTPTALDREQGSFHAVVIRAAFGCPLWAAQVQLLSRVARAHTGTQTHTVSVPVAAQ